MFDINEIRSLYKKKAVVFTRHFQARIDEREISFDEIRDAILSGDIIEQYHDDYPHPSALIFGVADGDKPLHVVVGVGNDKLWLITAYSPTLLKWEKDYKTRKAE